MTGRGSNTHTANVLNGISNTIANIRSLGESELRKLASGRDGINTFGADGFFQSSRDQLSAAAAGELSRRSTDTLNRQNTRFLEEQVKAGETLLLKLDERQSENLQVLEDEKLKINALTTGAQKTLSDLFKTDSIRNAAADKEQPKTSDNTKKLLGGAIVLGVLMS